ncbi:hypothetical protein ACED96_09010 [Clostridium thermobutyricum]|uniref:hypothetical protein n=1 Tax=Clostridium thermobutyricum TaxID=29372 RepID=UPI003F525863
MSRRRNCCCNNCCSCNCVSNNCCGGFNNCGCRRFNNCGCGGFNNCGFGNCGFGCGSGFGNNPLLWLLLFGGIGFC